VGVAVGVAVAEGAVVGVGVGVELEVELYTSTPSTKTEPLHVTLLAGVSHTPIQRTGVTTPLGTMKLSRFQVPGDRLTTPAALNHVLFASWRYSSAVSPAAPVDGTIAHPVRSAFGTTLEGAAT
jgi:hypothetical protein